MHRLNSLNYNYLKLKKEEIIYKVRFVYKYRVLLLHTAYTSRASARDHVTWNAKTVTKSNYIDIINKDSIFISNIYKDIVYFTLSINAIRFLKAKGKGL